MYNSEYVVPPPGFQGRSHIPYHSIYSQYTVQHGCEQGVGVSVQREYILCNETLETFLSLLFSSSSSSFLLSAFRPTCSTVRMLAT